MASILSYRRNALLAAAAALFSVSSAHAADKINYQDHILPIFRNSCLNCHNPDKKKAGLDLSTYAGAMAGSNNGAVINSGDPDGSLLYKAVTHAEDPTMPPKKDKLPDKELDAIKAWIAGGALETATGKPAVSTKPKVDLTVAAGAMKKPDGPPPMPRDLLPEPVVHATRPWAVGCIATNPWAPVVAIGGQHQILLYNTDTLELLGIVPFPDGEPQSVQFSRSGKLLIVGGGIAAKSGRVDLWDITTGQKLTSVGDEFDAVLAADLSPDQSYVALGGPSKVFKIYSTHDGSLVHVMKKHTDWVTAASFSTDGVLCASGDRAGGLFVWESKSGQEFYNLAGHKAAVTSIAFRDDSNFLASASEDGTVKLWDMQSGKEVKSWQAHNGGVLSVAFTHDGRLVTCGRDKTTRIWKSDGTQIRQFDAFDDIALHATFDYAGKRVIAGDWTGDLRVWNAEDGKLIGHLSSNPAPLADRLTAAEKRLGDSQAAADKAAADATAAQAAAEKAVQDQKDAEKALVDAKKAIDTTAAAAQSADTSVQSSKGAIARAQAAFPEKQAMLASATKAHGQMIQNRDAAKALAKPLEEALAARQKDAESAKKAADDAKAQADKNAKDEKLASAAKEKKIAADKARAAVDAAKAALKNRTDQVATLNDEVAKADAKVVKAKDALDAAKKALTEQTAAAEKSRVARAEAKAAIPKAKAAAVAAEKAIAPRIAQVKAAQENAAKAKTAAADAAQQLVNNRQEIARLKVGQFYLNVYAARQELTTHQAELDQAKAAATASQNEIDSDTAAIASAKKAMAEAPARLKDEEAAIPKATAALDAAKAADQAAQAMVAQKQALLKDATALWQKLWIDAPKNPNDKALAEAAAKAKATVESLTPGIEAAQKDADARADAVKVAADALAAAQATLAKDKASLETYPKKIAGWQQAIAAAQADIPKHKAAAEVAAKAVAATKIKVDQLSAEYQKKSQEAGLDAQASAASKG